MSNSSSQTSHQQTSAERFSSSGFILAAIGSAVGLGNMWKFPYITGKYGGAAFFLLFLICMLLVGLPVLLAEMTIGRGGRGNAVTSFTNLSKGKFWGPLSFISVLAPFFILSYYAVIAGWAIHYAGASLLGSLYTSPDYKGTFMAFAGGYMPIVWQFLILFVTGWVIIKGVSGGIEKFNRVLIPGFAILLIILMARALTLPNAGAGVEFFLKPDFSKLTAESALVALGHAFFSLSLGMGAMITYGAYVEKGQSLGKATLAIGFGDLLYALVAGLIIFPTVSSIGIEPSQGVGLIFMVLPAAFAAMPFGHLFGFLFFTLLTIAALTSTVAILEVPVAYVITKWNLTRKKATVLTAACVFIIGIPSALSLGPLATVTIAGKTYFDWFDFITSNIMLPLGGMIVTLFVGYVWKYAGKEAGLTGWWFRIWMFLIRYIAPIVMIVVSLYSLGIINFS